MSPLQRLKPYFKSRPRVQPATTAAAQPAQPAPGQPSAPSPPPVAPPALSADALTLESRREQLSRRYEELQSDLGGLVYEMAIRDHFRLDVVVRRAAALQAVDAELSSVEHQLGVGTATPSAACPSCGGPVSVTAQYCGRCGSTVGRPAVASTPVSARPGTPGGGTQ